MRSLHADLIAKQGGDIQPAILSVFTSQGEGTAYDYSFDPTVTTNRLEYIEYRQEPFDDYAQFMLRNEDLVVPDLRGYWVDLGIGANTDSGLRYGTYPRLWVKRQHTLSGGTKEQRANLKVILELEGVWNILREMSVLIGDAPFYNDNNGQLTGKTIYGILEYLIETTFSDLTGLSFTLDALGDQDDTVINSLILEPEKDPENPFLNQNAPDSFETFADVFERLFAWTGCYLRAKDGLAFKVIYPQSTDAVNETYYSSLTDGHVFYENTERQFVKAPGRIKVFSDQSGDGSWDPFIEGEAFSDDYTNEVFTGEYVPIIDIKADGNGVLTSQAVADNLATFILNKHLAETFGGRTIVPHDSRVELYDKILVEDSRGV